LPEVELLCRAIEDGDADDIGGQQIARELHAMPRQAQYMCQSVRKGCFADPGHILDEQMPSRKQTSQAQADLRRLAENDGLERLYRCLQRRCVGRIHRW
jgi:hypothetical protein